MIHSEQEAGDYPESVPALLEIIKSRGAATAITFEGRSISYESLVERVKAASAYISDLGVRHGDRVCIWLENSDEWIVFHLALASIGAITVPVSTRFKEFELRNIIAASGAIGLITQPHMGGVAPEAMIASPKEGMAALPNLKFVLELSEGSARVVRQVPSDRKANHSTSDLHRVPNGADIISIVYTSGTTGKPKGVCLSHQQVIRKGFGRASVHDFTADDQTLMLAPLYTVSGSVMSIYTSLASGSELVVIKQISGEAAIAALEKYRCTVIHGVCAIIQRMIDVAGDRSFVGRGIRNVNAGGGAISAKLLADIARVFGGTVTVSYGMSEATGAITYSRIREKYSDEYYLSGVGRPLPGVQVRVVNPTSKEELQDGETGEIQIRGYLVMSKYLSQAADGDGPVDSNGWLSSGDLGRIADGHLHFVGRLKESYRFNGFNVYPSEIEALLEKDNSVQAACVVPVPDSRFGEIGVAFLEEKSGHKVNTTELIGNIRNLVAGYKVPAHIHVISELPRAEGFKIDRARLRAEAKRLHSDAN